MSADNTDALRAHFEGRGLPDAAEFAEHVTARGWRFLPTQLEVLNLLSGPVGYDRPTVAAWHVKPDSALVIDYRETDGQTPMTDPTGKAYVRLRVEPPARFKATGKPAKYLAPPGRAPRLYLPGGVLDAAKAEGFLIVTEGEIKAEYATFRGYPTIAVSGVWNWKGRTGALKVTEGPNGERETEPETKPIPDLAALPWDELNAAGVVVLVGWDSDAAGKSKLVQARKKLREHLQDAFGARCQVLTIPEPGEGGKNGLDDYLASEGDFSLRGLIADALASDRTPEAIDRDDLSTAEAVERFGLNLKGSRYRITARGVGLLRGSDDDGEARVKVFTPRPIWPAAVGRDVSTGADMVKLAWVDGDGNERTLWTRKGIVGDKAALLALSDKDAPVSVQNFGDVASWLLEAGAYVLPERRGVLVASSLGWVNLPERGPVFAWPGAEGIEFIGESLPSGGDPAAWAGGLRLLLEQGEAGYLALACVGLSATSPLVRFLTGRRRPILGLAYSTSRGKSTVTGYALSVWASPLALSIQAMNSTPKGVEETAAAVPDLPILVDDFHVFAGDNAKRAGDLLYFLGNGQTRRLANKDGGARGGKLRFGVALYGAEYSVAGMMPGGADRRVIETTAAPLPDGCKALSDEIVAISNRNGGAIAPRLLAAIGPRAAEIAARADQDARALRADFPDLKGDDALTAALAALGLELLAEVTGLDLPAADVAAWLAGEAAAVRDERPDRAEEAFATLVMLVDAADWREDGRAWQGGVELAFLTDTSEGPAVDVNPVHEAIRRGLEPFGGDKPHRAIWAERGLILRDGAHMLSQKKIDGRKLRVLRVLRNVLIRYSRRPVPTGGWRVGTVFGGVGTAESGVDCGF